MKRVLHVMASLERSGMEQMLLSSADEWRAAGYACDVVATSEEIGQAAEAMRERGYGVFHLPFRNRNKALPRAAFVRDFYRLCARGYDVVHIQVEAGRPLYALIARLAGVPRLAVTPHSIFQFCGILRFRKMAERHLIRLLGGRYGMISEAVRTNEWKRFRIRGTRIFNWADTEHFRLPTGEERVTARRALGISEKEFVTISVGNCCYAKNHSALLEALASLPVNERPAHLHVGREEPGEPERALAERLGIEKTTHFFGSQPDTRSYLWAADAMLMPSAYEGFPLAAVEALACGLPLVCTGVGGLLDLARETEGTVLTSAESASIAEGVRTVMQMNAELRQARARRNSTYIREHYSVQSGVASIINGLYGESSSTSGTARAWQTKSGATAERQSGD